MADRIRSNFCQYNYLHHIKRFRILHSCLVILKEDISSLRFTSTVAILWLVKCSSVMSINKYEETHLCTNLLSIIFKLEQFTFLALRTKQFKCIHIANVGQGGNQMYGCSFVLGDTVKTERAVQCMCSLEVKIVVRTTAHQIACLLRNTEELLKFASVCLFPVDRYCAEHSLSQACSSEKTNKIRIHTRLFRLMAKASVCRTNDFLRWILLGKSL
jgi:hypothetical protein